MKFSIRAVSMFSAILAAGLYLNPGFAKETVKVDKATCTGSGGTYSSGSNYSRCEYSNGDSYTCNTDVNKCETCMDGKCSVSIKRPDLGKARTGSAQNAPPSKATSKKPVAGAPAANVNKK